jgi:PRTRC genetic system ThiF family protein
MTTELLEPQVSTNPVSTGTLAATGNQLDLSYLNASTLMIAPHKEVRIVLVGCGGTGSWLAPHLARIARVIIESGKKVSLYFVDHDKVEKANCYRQNFADCEIGLHKSRVLALRYGAAWGLDIAAFPERFSVERPNLYRSGGGDVLTVYIGCVDNAKARKYLALTIAHDNGFNGLPRSYWLDCGNAFQSGQVIIGSHHDPNMYDMKLAFDKLPGMCTTLPSPALVEPTLLLAKPEEEENAASNLSCEEMNALNVQSLTINQQIAGIASDYLLRLVLPGAGGLKRFATYIDMASGVARSKYITREAVGAVIENATTLVDKGKKVRAAG